MNFKNGVILVFTTLVNVEIRKKYYIRYTTVFRLQSQRPTSRRFRVIRKMGFGLTESHRISQCGIVMMMIFGLDVH